MSMCCQVISPFYDFAVFDVLTSYRRNTCINAVLCIYICCFITAENIENVKIGHTNPATTLLG